MSTSWAPATPTLRPREGGWPASTIELDMERFYELVRYGIVGVVNAGSYLALYTVLVVVGVPYLLAAVVAFPLPVALGYWLHERWTFASNAPTVRRLGMFLVLQIFAFAAGLGLLVLFVSGLGWNPIVARVVATPIGPLALYVVSRWLIFSGSRPLGAAALRDGTP